VNNSAGISVCIRLPFIIRCWRYWCNCGPKRGDGSVIAGSFFHRGIELLDSISGRRLLEGARVDVSCGQDTRTLYLDAIDLRTYQKVLPELQADAPEIRLARSLVTADTTFIDVGANMGVLSMLAHLGGAGRVISFEPNPVVARFLRRSCRVANATRSWTMQTVGLGSEPASTLLYADRFFSGTGSLHRHWQGTNGESFRIEVTTLDSWLTDSEGKHEPDINAMMVIKLDVEGWENEVLAGARSTILAARPYLWFELNQPSLGALKNDSPLPTAAVYQLGYRYAIEIGALPAIKRIDLAGQDSPEHRRTNILAVPDSLTKDFEQRVLTNFRNCGPRAGSPAFP